MIYIYFLLLITRILGLMYVIRAVDRVDGLGESPATLMIGTSIVSGIVR